MTTDNRSTLQITTQGILVGALSYVAVSTVAATGATPLDPPVAMLLVSALALMVVAGIACAVVRRLGCQRSASSTILLLSVVAIALPPATSMLDGSVDLPALLLSGGRSLLGPLLAACIVASGPPHGTAAASSKDDV